MANKSAIREWVADLRSGKYKQGKEALRRRDRFCCMGVACDTYRRVTGNGEWDEGLFLDGTGDSREMVLPWGVQEWLGTNHNPILHFPRATYSCGDANDTRRRTFAEIADALERTYLTDEDTT